jgi:hypothetical protein
MNHRQSAELKAKHELHEFLLIFSLNKSNEIAINATFNHGVQAACSQMKPDATTLQTSSSHCPLLAAWVDQRRRPHVDRVAQILSGSAGK